MKFITSRLLVCFFVCNFFNDIISMQEDGNILYVLSKSHAERKTIFIHIPARIYQPTNSSWDRIFEHDGLLRYVIDQAKSDYGITIEEHIQAGFFKLSCDAEKQNDLITYLKEHKSFISDVWQEREFTPSFGQMYAMREKECRHISDDKCLALDRKTAHLAQLRNAPIKKNETIAYIQFALKAWRHYMQTHNYESKYKDYHLTSCGFIGLAMQQAQQSDLQVRITRNLRPTLYEIAYCNKYSLMELNEYFTLHAAGFVKALWNKAMFTPERALCALNKDENDLAREESAKDVVDTSTHDEDDIVVLCNIL